MTFKEKVNEMKIHHEEHKEERHERHEEKKFAHEIKHQMKEEERLKKHEEKSSVITGSNDDGICYRLWRRKNTRCSI